MNISSKSPIALIDSGIGGLSLLKSLTKKYPNENYIYLADNQYMPYGNKSAKVLQNRLLELINFLYNDYSVKLVILACNTASASALAFLNKHSPVKVLGLNIANLFGDNTKIICTKLSAKCFKGLNTYPCPKLANDIEGNIFNKANLSKKIKRLLVKADISEDNIVLGCTHYELVGNIFAKVLPNKNFIYPCAEFVKNLKLTNPNTSSKGDVLMISTLATKSYIDKLWKIFKS
ncbi:MAG: aspartate/glutamate racemase family protein [Clostridia bacterium]|nr:aspartate/glutamate racemase family protein [Clostridia bacterium]